jgi:hypothetical protein
MQRTASSPARHARSRLAVLPLCLVALCLACGDGSQVGVTAAGTSQHLAPVSYSATVRVPSRADTPVSASCRAGEQVVGGGFAAGDLFEYAAWVSASYPSSATTWTVTGSAPASFFDLAAVVYCAPLVRPASVQIIHASGAGSATATCPQGTVLLGGGFHAAQPVSASQPRGNGWMAGSTSADSGGGTGGIIDAYALCTSGLVRASQVVQATFNAHSMSRGYQPGGADAACPSGQLALGGGFAAGELVLASQTRDASFSGWAVEAGGEADVTISAVCVRPLA